MKYLPLLYGIIATVAINFLASSLAQVIGLFVFGIGGSATMYGYTWLLWVFYISFVLLGIYGFSRLDRRYGGERLLFLLCCWVVVFILERYSISIISLGIWLGDTMGQGATKAS